MQNAEPNCLITDPNPPHPTLNSLVLPPITSTQAVALIDAKPLTPATPAGSAAGHLTLNSQSSTLNAHRSRHRRKGRVASLPKLQRDMVNHMLWNGIPYKNIVAALDDAGFKLIERNISNWATGGYLEWRLEQEAVLENRLNQDHLLDFLRRDDAPDLPEVGLQAAATRLSQVLLQKLAHAENPEANLDTYTKMIDLLCRLNREISVTQKNRDDARRTLGREYDPVRVKDVEQVSAIEMERSYSDPCPQSSLPRPAVPPLLPQIPTATFLADQAAEERHEAELARIKHANAMMRSILEKNSSAVPPMPSPKTQRATASALAPEGSRKPAEASRKPTEGIGR
jgi:hypothetical protein